MVFDVLAQARDRLWCFGVDAAIAGGRLRRGIKPRLVFYVEGKFLRNR